MYKNSYHKEPSTIKALGIKFQQLCSQKTAQLSGKANAAPTDEIVASAGHLSKASAKVHSRSAKLSSFSKYYYLSASGFGALCQLR
jgi:hypothetical protein